MREHTRSDREVKREGHIGEPPLRVEWTKLTGVGQYTQYKSICPVCDRGILLVYRNRETMELESHDRCMYCGQVVIYTDIEDMRAVDRGDLPFPKRKLEEQ